MSKQKGLDYNALDSVEVSSVERHLQFEHIFKEVAPKVKSHAGRLIIAQIILVLRLEGIIGKKLSKQDLDFVESLKSKLVNNKEMLNETLKNINNIMRDVQ